MIQRTKKKKKKTTDTKYEKHTIYSVFAIDECTKLYTIKAFVYSYSQIGSPQKLMPPIELPNTKNDDPKPANQMFNIWLVVYK